MSNQITISSCLIIKNEMPHIINLIGQLSQFSDQIVIVDTGSTDGFLEKIDLYKDSIVEIYRKDWTYDFSEARNYSFSLAKCDYIFWCDADDELTNSLINWLIEFKSLDNPPKMINIPYMYWINRPNELFNKMRLFDRNLNLVWHGRIHEVLYYDLNAVTEVDHPEINIIKHSHVKPNGTRNYDIFRAMDSSGEVIDTRDLYYYGMEMLNVRQFVPAYLTLCECAINTNSFWVDRVNAASGCKWLIEAFIPNFKPTITPLDIYRTLYEQNVKRCDSLCKYGDLLVSSGNKIEAMRVYEEAVQMDPPKNENDFLYESQYTLLYPAMQLVRMYYDIGLYNLSELMNERVLMEFPTNANALYNRSLFMNNHESNKTKISD